MDLLLPLIPYLVAALSGMGGVRDWWHVGGPQGLHE